jgi:lipoate-protein ligase A
MQYLDLTFPTPPENLACDEALLNWCEDGYDQEILRFWEAHEHFVALGYTNKAASEVDLPACRQRGIPVLRRCSGGGTVLQGPGCLNYALILKIRDGGPLNSVTEANSFIMERQRQSLEPLLNAAVEIQGCTDLAIGELKFSGNAQRRKRRFLLFHGTLLLNFDIPLVERVLRMPSRQPSYRRDRTHSEFLKNLGIPSHCVKQALKSLWNAVDELKYIPSDSVDRLVQQKYATDEWNLKF